MNKRYYTRITLLINSLWSVPVVVLIRLLRPFYYFRIGTIRADRIGHFCADFVEQSARLKLKKNKVIDLYWLNETCNKQWEKVVRRSLPVYDFLKYVDYWNNKIPGGRKHVRPSSLTNSRDMKGLYLKYDVGVPFTSEESETAKAWLRSRGWSDCEPFVCLLVRDSRYLLNENNLKGYDWSYHNYRDSDIDTYNDAILWLANQGVWVLRMGKSMNKQLSISHPKVHDYAFDDTRSDLLDIWLFAKCTACISTLTGIDVAAEIHRKPVLYLNMLPLAHLHSYSNQITVPKRLVCSDNQMKLTLHEYLKCTYFKSSAYLENSVSIIDLTAEEILEGVKEFWIRIKGKYIETEQERMLQKKFWLELKAWPEFSKYHDWVHPEARVGSAWLRSQNESFFTSDVVGQVEERRNIKDEVLVN